MEKKMRLNNIMKLAALIPLATVAISTSPFAGDLLSGTASTLGNNLAAVHVDTNVVGDAAKADVNLGTQGTLNSKAKVDLARTIHARASLLNNKRLLALCINVGAQGCGSASRTKQLALIQAKVDGLSGQRLVDACVAVGGGCGMALASGGGGTGGGGNTVTTRGGTGSMLASSGSSKDRDVKFTCRSVLSNPVRYETGLVKLCRQMAQ
jgi:hypothetical protein